MLSTIGTKVFPAIRRGSCARKHLLPSQETLEAATRLTSASRTRDSSVILITIECNQNASYRYEGYDAFTVEELA